MHERIAYAVTVFFVAAGFVVLRPADEGIISAAVAEPPLFSAPDVTPVSDPEPRSGAYSIHRNLFSFDEPPPRVIAPVVEIPVAAPAVTPVETPRVEEPSVPQPPAFDYRYIGRFGPEANPIAAFARNGEIVNARRGETIDGRFVVRTIGLESVDIGFVAFPAASPRRVGMGE
jgi:hypothetical protein